MNDPYTDTTDHELELLNDAADALGDLSWHLEARCRESKDPDRFFPTRGNRKVHLTKNICRACPVQAQCLDYAVSTGQRYGIWGGRQFG